MTMETFLAYVLLPALGTLAGSFTGAAIALRGALRDIRRQADTMNTDLKKI